MLNKKIFGVLGAAAIVATSAAAFATTDATFEIVPEGSYIRIGGKTFDIGAGSLFANIGNPSAPSTQRGTCGFGIDAARSNPTFQPVDVGLGVKATLELCDNVTGQVTDTTPPTASDPKAGTITAPGTRIKVKLRSLFVNCEIPCVTINFASNRPEGQDYTVDDGTVKLVDDGFAVDAAPTCTKVVNDFLGLPSAAGKNIAVLSLQTAAPGPECAAPALPADASTDATPDSETAPPDSETSPATFRR